MSNKDDYRIADIGLHEFGRKEIRLAEHEMPGLMSLRAEYFDEQPEGPHSRVTSHDRSNSSTDQLVLLGAKFVGRVVIFFQLKTMRQQQ